MREFNPVAGGRTGGGGASRRPSYPAEQWINQASSATRIWVKVAISIAYFFCVSISAFILAIYYAVFWSASSSNSSSSNSSSSNSTNASTVQT